MVENPQGVLPYSKMEILFEDEGHEMFKEPYCVPDAVLALDYNHKLYSYHPWPHRTWNIQWHPSTLEKSRQMIKYLKVFFKSNNNKYIEDSVK